mgnify:CR=1 FL=1
MNEKQVFGIVLLIAGIGTLIFGISHINSGYSQLRSAMGGGSDGTGIASSIGGAIIAIVGLLMILAKPANTVSESQRNENHGKKDEDLHNIFGIQNSQPPSETATAINIPTTENANTIVSQMPNPENEMIAKLKQFKQLLDDGILTQQEYEQQKSKILNS